MKKMIRQRKRLDRFWIGLLAGILMVCAMVFVFFYQNNWELNQFWGVMRYTLPAIPAAALQFTMLCLLPNSMLAFLSYRFELWDTYKGIMFVTFLSFVPLILLLF